MTRLFLPTAAAACAAIVAVSNVAPPVVAQRTDVKSLRAVFDVSRGAVRDTNGDGLADSVAARVIVPARPTPDDVQAAANIAARIAYETTALTLPLVARDTEVSQPASIAFPILVGRQNSFVRRLIDAGKLDIASLKPGQGIVALVASPLGGPDGVVVVGGDDEGTATAALQLAARLPRLWSQSGIALRGIEEQAIRYLQAHGVRASDAFVSSVLVDSDRRGVASVAMTASVPGADGARALAAFNELDAAHSRGFEPRTLNFANVAATVVDVSAEGRSAGRATVRRSGFNSRTLTPPIDPDELASDSPGDRGTAPAAAPGAGPGKTFDLSNAYSIEGWFGDVYNDLIPDRLETGVVIDRGDDTLGAAHIAARLGLESTGVTLPLLKIDETVREPAREQNPIIIGRANGLLDRLVKIGKARVDDLQPGEGVVQIVPRAFGSNAATVVAGRDASGTEAAATYLGRRVPFLWDTQRGAPSFDDVTRDVSRLLQAKSGAGQASQALGEVDEVLRGLKGKTVESFEVKLFLEDANPALDKFLIDTISAAVPGVAPKVATQAITEAVPVFEDKIDIPWEVDEFWTRFRAEVLPKVTASAPVDVELRVSESPQVRKSIADQIRAELTKAGAKDPRVRVLSAYKQGFLWLTEEVMPELKRTGAKSVRMKIGRLEPDFTKKFKFYQVPSRWVHELYPVDDVFQRDLGISNANFSMELVDRPKDIYSIDGLDGAGKVVFQASFSPKTVEREYLEKFPGWSRVLVTTGWMTARVGTAVVSDARIETDAERFWDYYQSKALPKIYDYVMKTTDNRPLPDKQPFHRDLDVEVWMSEPDFKIGLDEELISSLESIHEDLYFVTLDFFDALGRTTTRRRLAAPGKIFPIIHPERAGKPGQARILYAGNASAKPRIELSYKEKGIEKPTRVSRELTRIETSAPSALRVVARADRVTEIELQVEPKDDREATRAADVVDNLARLQTAGIYKDQLSYDHVDRIALAITSKEARTRRTIKSTGTSRPSNVRVAQGGGSKGPIVTWDHVISPDESEALVGKLAAFPAVKAYKAGRSYRGRDISVMEITAPTRSELVSLAKLTALKPTIFITGRQHANEVSSTSHILKLAELLATDPAYAEYLKKVNVILHPVENPDGAQMAYDLQKLTPTHMLHAGRYSALGMDVGSQVGQTDPLLPESLVRGNVWREWLPDIYLNPHGYPSHEWVQQFAGYVPPGFRTYLSTRGWYTSVSGLRDPRHPAHAQATEAMREAIVREINSNADVKAMNLRHQGRYRRWAFGFGPYVFNQEIYKETAIYYSNEETGEPSGSRRAGAGGRGGGGGGEGAPAGGGRFSMNAWPQVTFFNSGTEAPDETAQGDWLNLVSKAGFSYLMASLKYLRDGDYAVERIGEDGQRDSASITMLRVRPVMPKKAAQAPTSNQH